MEQSFGFSEHGGLRLVWIGLQIDVDCRYLNTLVICLFALSFLLLFLFVPCLLVRRGPSSVELLEALQVGILVVFAEIALGFSFRFAFLFLRFGRLVLFLLGRLCVACLLFWLRFFVLIRCILRRMPSSSKLLETHRSPSLLFIHFFSMLLDDSSILLLNLPCSLLHLILLSWFILTFLVSFVLPRFFLFIELLERICFSILLPLLKKYTMFLGARSRLALIILVSILT